MIGPMITQISTTFAATAAESGFAAAMFAGAAATWAALWPVLAVIAAVALVAGGGYLLVKNWNAVVGFFAGLWEKIKGAFSAAFNWIKSLLDKIPGWILIFVPFFGIPARIIKHWDTIKAFFVGLWVRIKEALPTRSPACGLR
jgi:phage-related minor tail protein